jgi:cyclopropane fatty-acyl-phospholipid synthase-like methyltransferase
MSVPDNWYESFFHGVTLDLWRRAIPPAQTRAEAEFLREQLQCAEGAQVLDVPCGNGRLSFELAKLGLRVTGIDISEEFIAEAKSIQRTSLNPSAHADGTDLVAPVDFILGDMRRVEGSNIYDGGYCFGNSFAFLGHDETETFIGAVARALKPGSRFIVHTGMAAESVLPDFEEQSCHELGDLSLTIKERYVVEESCIDSEYIFEREGKKETRMAREWIYTVAEMRRMLGRAGFEVLHLYGTLQREPYRLGLRELFIVSALNGTHASGVQQA